MLLHPYSSHLSRSSANILTKALLSHLNTSLLLSLTIDTLVIRHFGTCTKSIINHSVTYTYIVGTPKWTRNRQPVKNIKFMLPYFLTSLARA